MTDESLDFASKIAMGFNVLNIVEDRGTCKV